MQTLMHNWYWARAKVGPYTVIASHITATETYGYEIRIIYMLARGDEVIAGDDTRVSFQIERVATDRKTGKPVADITRYTYRDGDTRYVVTFERQKTILQTVFREEMPLIKRLLAKIIGFDGAYHRFTGKVTIEKFEKDVRVEIFDDHAIWELMYFGKTKQPRACPHAGGYRMIRVASDPASSGLTPTLGAHGQRQRQRIVPKCRHPKDRPTSQQFLKSQLSFPGPPARLDMRETMSQQMCCA
jgi:hypothetical protein